MCLSSLSEERHTNVKVISPVQIMVCDDALQFVDGQKLLHVKRLEEFETNTDQLTNLGLGGVSSTCPTTKVISPHTWGKLTDTGCLIIKKIISHYPFVCRLINITLNDSEYMNV